jgi:hypothetical protein
MEKSTKLIIAAIGLGGLGYFLYKKGLFSKKTTTEVAKGVEKVEDVVKKIGDVVTDVVDTGKKTAVELATKPCEVIKWNCRTNPRETIQIPYDANCNDYQYEMPPCAPPRGGGDESFIKLYEPIGFRDNTYYDQPTRIDYNSGKYNQEEPVDYYMGRDIVNARFNQYLYA